MRVLKSLKWAEISSKISSTQDGKPAVSAARKVRLSRDVVLESRRFANFPCPVRTHQHWRIFNDLGRIRYGAPHAQFAFVFFQQQRLKHLLLLDSTCRRWFGRWQ